jgi:hypothetical protein
MPVSTVSTYSCLVYNRYILLEVGYLSWYLQVQYSCVARSICIAYVCRKVQDHWKLIDVRKQDTARILPAEEWKT